MFNFLYVLKQSLKLDICFIQQFLYFHFLAESHGKTLKNMEENQESVGLLKRTFTYTFLPSDKSFQIEIFLFNF